MKKIRIIAAAGLILLLTGCRGMSVSEKISALDLLPADVSGVSIINPAKAVEFITPTTFAAMGINDSVQNLFLNRTETILAALPGGDSAMTGSGSILAVITGRFTPCLINTGMISMPGWDKVERKIAFWHNEDMNLSLAVPVKGFLLVVGGSADRMLEVLGAEVSFREAALKHLDETEIESFIQDDMGILYFLDEAAGNGVEALRISMVKNQGIYNLGFFFKITNGFMGDTIKSAINGFVYRSCRPAGLSSKEVLKDRKVNATEKSLDIYNLNIQSEKIVEFFSVFSKYLSGLMGDETSLSFDNFF